MSKNKSFTLIELLVVIVIIGILAGVIVISTSSSIDKANFAKAQAFSNTVQNELLSNLVSEWTFDEPQVGNITKDSWGTNHGTVVGATQVDDCVYGKCYSFDGVDDYIDFGDILRPSRVEDRTYSFWAKLDSYDGTLFSTGSLYHSKRGYSLFRLLNVSSIQFSYELNDSPYSFTFDCPLHLEKWMFFVVSSEPNDPNIKFNLYKDGLLKDVQTKAMAVGNQYNTSFKIGARTENISLTQFLNGYIDDFRVYNSVLSSAEIKQNYIAGLESLYSKGTLSETEFKEKIEKMSSNK